MSDELTKARIEGAMFAAEFILTHYERGADGGSIFTPYPVDPEQWWAGMSLVSMPKFMAGSAEHHRARINRWKELLVEQLTGDKDD